MFDTNPTQIIGVLVFAAAGAACLVASRRARGAAASHWKVLAVLQFVFLAEIVFGLRHAVHDVVDAFLIDGGWYGQRHGVQLGLLVVALLVAVVGLWAVVRWSRTHPVLRPAALASAAVVGLFALEMISLHAIDAVLYLRVGPLMLIAALWAACATVVVASALRRR